MPESYVQVPVDSTGKKLRTRQRVIGANTVEEQFIAQSAEPTWWAYAAAIVPASNKHYLSCLNAAGSGQAIKLKKLFIINQATAAVTGALLAFDIKKATAVSSGTAVTPLIMDSVDSALTNFTCVTGGTVTEGALFFPAILNSEEMPATTPATLQWQVQQTNLVLESVEMKELNLRPGEGFTVKQTNGTTAGSMGILAGFTKEV